MKTQIHLKSILWGFLQNQLAGRGVFEQSLSSLSQSEKSLVALNKIFGFVMVLILPLISFADVGFDKDQNLIPREVFEKLSFPRDLDKTNLHMVRQSVDHPFEWAGHMESIDGRACTAGVVALPGYRRTDRVLVLTAGHCLRMDGDELKPRVSLVNVDLNGSTYFNFSRARTIKGQKVYKIPFKKVIFAAFDVYDFALIEMEFAYQDLDYKDESPPLLRSWSYKKNEEVTSFGVPQSAEFYSARFHMSSCRTDLPFFYVGPYGNTDDLSTRYLMQSRIRFSCTVFGGMSGGYVRDSNGFVIGVNAGVTSQSSFFATIKPLMSCVLPEAKLDQGCLNDLKKNLDTYDFKDFEG